MMYSAKPSLAADAPPSHDSERLLPPERLPSVTQAEARAAAKMVIGSGSGKAHGFGTCQCSYVQWMMRGNQD
jgi:hypothetical protein